MHTVNIDWPFVTETFSKYDVYQTSQPMWASLNEPEEHCKAAGSAAPKDLLDEKTEDLRNWKIMVLECGEVISRNEEQQELEATAGISYSMYVHT